MDNLIERYIYDVTRRLPEQEREEVGKELRSNIYDMLPDHADEDQIKAVLYQLGIPAALAEKYRQKPRYLISPAIYDEYVRVLKLVLPLVGVVGLAVGMVLGIVDAVQYAIVDLISNMISNGISLGVSSAFQALVWTTAGFAIAERTGAKSGNREWKVEDLPEIPPGGKGGIPLSDSIAGLVTTVVFSVVAILLCSGVLPFAFIIQNGETQIRSLFNPEFLADCIPAIAVMTIFGVVEYISRIRYRRWTPFVCGATVISSLANAVILLYLINRPDLFSAEFTDFIRSIDWGSYVLRFMGKSGIGPAILFTSIVIVAVSIAQCAHAIYRTLTNRK